MFITATIISISACVIAALIWNHVDRVNAQKNNVTTVTFDYDNNKAA